MGTWVSLLWLVTFICVVMTTQMPILICPEQNLRGIFTKKYLNIIHEEETIVIILKMEYSCSRQNSSYFLKTFQVEWEWYADMHCTCTLLGLKKNLSLFLLSFLHKALYVFCATLLPYMEDKRQEGADNAVNLSISLLCSKADCGVRKRVMNPCSRRC